MTATITRDDSTNLYDCYVIYIYYFYRSSSVFFSADWFFYIYFITEQKNTSARIFQCFNILVFNDEVQLRRKAFNRRLARPRDITYNFLRIIPNWPADVSVSHLFLSCIDLGIIGRLYGAPILLARFRAMLRLLVLMMEVNYYESMDVVSIR